jgi:cytochrome oxidase Cu insertion factor (SCO1/SenC/PrrC family)
MKKGLLILSLFLWWTVALSQTAFLVQRTADQSSVKSTVLVGDFTITDSDGVTWNLYDQLALGKTVFLDLFFST